MWSCNNNKSDVSNSETITIQWIFLILRIIMTDVIRYDNVRMYLYSSDVTNITYFLSRDRTGEMNL